MKRAKQLTLALPAIILIAGLVVPAVFRNTGGARPSAAPVVPLLEGKTAEAWRAQALASLKSGRLNRALREIKTAERVEPGVQYRGELDRIRRARWEARRVARLRDRLLAGEPEDLALDPQGAVLAGHRTTVALPGESLWTLARALVSAERGVPPEQLPAEEPAIYRAWDRLTDLNGLRELDVGEPVLIPLPEEEIVAVGEANARDLSRIERGLKAVGAGDLDTAVALHDSVRGEFALAADSFASFERALSAARECRLTEDALAATGQALGLSRPSEHGRMVRLLEQAREAMDEARVLSGEARHAEDAGRIEGLLAEARNFRVEDDGSVITTKPPGRTYTETARLTVEWFLGRRLVSSGREYPYVGEKTDDELAWARYLDGAEELARLDGVDFVTLLESVDEEVEIRLPNPGTYFAE